MDRIVKKSIFFVPQGQAVGSMHIDRVRNVGEVLKEFARHIFVCGVFARQFERNRKHIQAVHSHPTRAVRLLKMPAGW